MSKRILAPELVQNQHPSPRIAEARLAAPPPPDRPLDWGVMAFLLQVVALENPLLSVQGNRTLPYYVQQVSALQRFFDAANLARGVPSRPIRLADVTSGLLGQAMAWRIDQGCTAGSANKLRTALLSIVNFAINEHGFPITPLRVRKLKEMRRVPQAWSIEQFENILLAAGNRPGFVGPVPAGMWWQALLLTLFNTGLRINALMHCPSRGLDLAGGTLHVPAEVQKQKCDQLFHLLPQTIDALRMVDPHRHPTIFADSWPHDRYRGRSWVTLTRSYKGILVDAGLFDHKRDVTKLDLFHRIRKTTATFIAAGAGRPAAQGMLGHSAPRVTDRYIDPHYMPEFRLADVLPPLRVALRAHAPAEMQLDLYQPPALQPMKTAAPSPPPPPADLAELLGGSIVVGASTKGGGR